MTRPTYDHTPDDSAETPCIACAVLDSVAIKARLETAALARGTTSQRERHARGLLPEPELTALARGELYKPLEPFRRWGKIRQNHARHDHGCKVPTLTDAQQAQALTFQTVEGAKLEHDEYSTLRSIEQVVDEIRAHPWLTSSAGSVNIIPMTHTAQCSMCVGPVVTRHSARVVVTWAWRLLVREYAL